MTAVLPCPQKLDAMSVEGHSLQGRPGGKSSHRVHPHGVCVSDSKQQHIGRSWGGLTSKIHAVVDANGRRVATRYDKLAANYLACIKLASIRIWPRANESTP
jgi:hypothetical protein